MASNTETIRNLYDAFARGDIQTVLEALAPNVEWTEAEGFPYGGTFIGPDAVLQNVFMKLGTEWDGYAAVPHEFIADTETVIALVITAGNSRLRARASRLRSCTFGGSGDDKVATFCQHTDTAVVQRALE